MNEEKWTLIENLIIRAQQPIADPWLRSLNADASQERLNYYHFLYLLVKATQPKVALEIGVETGIASAYMCKAAHEYGGLVIGIDLRPDVRKLITEVLPSQFYYVFLNEDSLTASTKCQAVIDRLGRKPIGLVYQDSSHHYRASQQEFAFYSPMVNGIWICDDITPSFHDPAIDPPGKGMVQYFEELPGDKRTYKNVLHYGNCQGMVMVNGSD